LMGFCNTTKNSAHSQVAATYFRLPVFFLLLFFFPIFF
jgi:hypothetical protein